VETAIKQNAARPEVSATHPIPEKGTDVVLDKGYLQAVFYQLTHWETWDWRIKYVLIAPAWIWFCIRARSFWFFTASNPTLTFGGFDGESKREMYDQLPPGSYPRTHYISPSVPFRDVTACLEREGYSFPIAVKPDVGKMGLMFRRIDSINALHIYHNTVNFQYIIQEWTSYPVEVSVFYYRLPHQQKGTITGFVRKDFLEVTGDGRSTLEQLIRKHPRTRFRIAEMRAKHREKMHVILRSGEKYCLSPALNLSRGGKLVSLAEENDDRLLKVFDDLSHYTGNFFYGRYDIKCASIEELKQGKDFSILEFNGSGAEPHHVYGNGNHLLTACRILVDHWGMLCSISRQNHRLGVPYWDFQKGLKFIRKAGEHLDNLKKLDSDLSHG
jgi:hypothetical protein